MPPLLNDTRGQLFDLCRKHHVERLDIFGSATTDHFHPDRSDLDLLVWFDPDMPANRFRNYFDLKWALEDLLDLPVDLVEPGGIGNDHYRRGIEATREPFYAA